MRILGYLEHPSLKITVFKNDNRLSLKLENEGYEQTFKLREDGLIESLDDVKRLADDAFLAQIQSNFQAMHRARLAAMSRAFPADDGDVFEEII